MNKSNVDLAVLIIFFVRPLALEKVFNEVKKARPSKLFLACDGPRNERDKEKIVECKKIVSNIDWECEVYENYSLKNKGCGKGPSEAISWAFDYVDKLLIIEDDCVPNLSLFPFMKEMLDKYENDTRIGFISGFNHFKEWETNENSYFFTKCAATLGWGTWKRVWDNYDYFVKNINDPYCCELLKRELINKRAGKERVKSWKMAASDSLSKKIDYWDIQFGFLKYTQSYLCIVPKKNLIYNVGIGEGSTHTEKSNYEVWKPGRILFMPTSDMEFPLKHPDYVICDRTYDEKYFKSVYPNNIKRIFRIIKKIIRRIF